MTNLDDVFIIDTETGGLDIYEHSLMSVALVTGDGKASMEIWVAEPTIFTTEVSLQINRLDPSRLAAEGLSPNAACDALEAFVTLHAPGKPPTVAGHNIAFDLAFLRRLYNIAGRGLPTLFSHRTLDTHTLLWALARTGRLPPNVVGSDAAFSYFGISPPEALRHTALGDAEATRELLQRLLDLQA